MSSVLSSFFSRDPRTSFPYSLPTETFTVLTQELINVGKSLKKVFLFFLSNFLFFSSQNLKKRPPVFWTLNANSTSLKIQAQKLKTLRHPNVLAYLDSLEVFLNFWQYFAHSLPSSAFIYCGFSSFGLGMYEVTDHPPRFYLSLFLLWAIEFLKLTRKDTNKLMDVPVSRRIGPEPKICY